MCLRQKKYIIEIGTLFKICPYLLVVDINAKKYIFSRKNTIFLVSLSIMKSVDEIHKLTQYPKINVFFQLNIRNII